METQIRLSERTSWLRRLGLGVLAVMFAPLLVVGLWVIAQLYLQAYAWAVPPVELRRSTDRHHTAEIVTVVWRDDRGRRQVLVLEEDEGAPGVGFFVRFDSTDEPGRPGRRYVRSDLEAYRGIQIIGGRVESMITGVSLKIGFEPDAVEEK
jgi:hypothetical protein